MRETIQFETANDLMDSGIYLKILEGRQDSEKSLYYLPNQGFNRVCTALRNLLKNFGRSARLWKKLTTETRKKQSFYYLKKKIDLKKYFLNNFFYWHCSNAGKFLSSNIFFQQLPGQWHLCVVCMLCTIHVKYKQQICV